MTAENKTRLLLNDGMTEHVPAGVIGGFVEMAAERAAMEIPYRAASLYALSVGDVDWSRTIMTTVADNLAAAEREKCAVEVESLIGSVVQDGDAMDEAWRAAADLIRKDRGCEPPQAETKFSNRELLQFIDQLYSLHGHGGANDEAEWWAGREWLIDAAKASR